jgi:hypothetical protein
LVFGDTTVSNKLTFEKLKAYCKNNNISDVERNIAYSIYEEQLQELIAKRTSAQNRPSEEEIATMQEMKRFGRTKI